MKGKLKVLHVLHSVGGVEVYLRTILENMCSEKITSVVVHGCNDTANRFLDNKKRQVNEYKISIERQISILKDPMALIQLMRIIYKEKPIPEFFSPDSD